MSGQLFTTGRELYYQDRLWQLLVQVVFASIFALGLIALCSTLFANNGTTSASSNQAQASYKPTVPPKAFGGTAPGSQSGRVLNMPISAEDIASDDRLKELHLAAQSVDKSAPKAQQCEQYVTMLNPITSYDKKRAKPVHNRILSDAERCKLNISKSDNRLKALDSAGIAYQDKASVDNAIHLVNSASAITDYDKQRTGFSSYQNYLDETQDAEKLKVNSDNRLSALNQAYSKFKRSTSTETEAEVLKAYSQVNSLDRERELDKKNKVLLQSATQLVSAQSQRTNDLKRLKTLSAKVDSSSALTSDELEQLATLIERLNQVNPSLLSNDERSQVSYATQASFRYQEQQLSKLVRKYKVGQDVELLEPIANQYSRIKSGYPQLLADLDNDLVIVSEKVAEKIEGSDNRLSSLTIAASNLSKKMTPNSIDALKKAKDALISLDLERMNDEHKKAINLEKKAVSGELESDKRINQFVLAYNTYVTQGCTKVNLRNLSSTKSALTSLDKDRATSKVKNAINMARSYTSRSYCVGSTLKSIKPI
ncbi:hypothetical protein J7X21_001993 [Vibrio parahaemolyticus]|nr:hypothetical protein [Vibrio parahaemolyticus]EHH2462801.1 hypothetical protein [Vibrio parahaemolyticus]EJG1580757.1 hypothetical protein [Vibrio parahaemolyticus]